jgi:hypothetical protein
MRSRRPPKISLINRLGKALELELAQDIGKGTTREGHGFSRAACSLNNGASASDGPRHPAKPLLNAGPPR